MGLTTCSDPSFAVLQPSRWFGKQEKGNSLKLSGVSFIPTALAKTAMTSLSLSFAISYDVPVLFMLCCCFACELGLRGHVPVHMRFSVFHMLFFFYSKHGTCWTDYSDWQAAWMCLLSLVVWHKVTSNWWNKTPGGGYRSCLNTKFLLKVDFSAVQASVRQCS